MADAKISALTAAAAALATHEFPANEGGASRKVTGTQLLAMIGNTLNNYSAADQTITAATTAYLDGSAITVPAGNLRVGTVFRWTITLSKTAAGTAANTFNVRIGTAGTTADTSRVSFALPVGTAAIDVGTIDVMVTIRGPLSASGIAQGQLRMTHNLSATGLSTLPGVAINAISAAFDVTASGLIVGLSCTTAAATVLTFQQVVAEALNL